MHPIFAAPTGQDFPIPYHIAIFTAIFLIGAIAAAISIYRQSVRTKKRYERERFFKGGK